MGIFIFTSEEGRLGRREWAGGITASGEPKGKRENRKWKMENKKWEKRFRASNCSGSTVGEELR
jgi:hypothetical protein